MVKSVMMSMVFAVVLLLKSAAIPTPHAVEEGIWVIGVAFKSLAAGAGKEFFVGERLTLTFAPNSNEKRLKRVTKAAYKRCNALNYIEDLTTDGNGQVNVTFYLAGDYYYISPSFDYYKRGLKVHISVSATPEASPSPIPLGSSSPAVSVGVLVPMMAVVMGFFF